MEKTRFCTMMVRKHHRDCVWYLLANDRVVVMIILCNYRVSFVCLTVLTKMEIRDAHDYNASSGLCVVPTRERSCRC
jgi:hypothetical protein